VTWGHFEKYMGPTEGGCYFTPCFRWSDMGPYRQSMGIRICGQQLFEDSLPQNEEALKK